MNIPFKFILIMSFLVISINAYAEESFETFAARLDSWVEDTQGVVVSVDKNGYSVDIGRKAGAFKGAILNIARDGEELLHPVTGQSLGRKHINLGVLKLSEIFDKYSVGALVIKNSETVIKKGDKVGVEKPLPVKIALGSLDTKTAAEAKYAILKSGLFLESKESPYSIRCELDEQNSQSRCSLSFQNNKIITTEVPLMLSVITTASNTVQITNGRALSHKFDTTIENIIISAAIGKVLGKDDLPTVILADKNNVHIYSILDNSLTETTMIEDTFNSIVNIEAADLNGNGTDEIFISNMDKKGLVSSAIYEYDGSKFTPLKQDIKLLFRSFFSSGSKKIICQAFNDGDFSGLIYTYAHGEKGYEEYEAFDKSFGAKLYGFAYGAFGGRGFGYTMNFNNTGNFTITSSQGDKFTFGKGFGYTPHKLLYSKTLMTGTDKDNNGALINIFDTKVFGFPVYQRIIEIESAPSKFYMLSNDTERRRDGEVDYLKYSSGIYMYIRNEAVILTPFQGGDRAALEADILYSPKDKYLITLSQIGKNGQAFAPISSVIGVYSVNR